jgi:putative endonuclease
MTQDRKSETVIDSHRRHSLGKAGESIARKYLENQGFHIYHTNYRRRSGEIDIIAKQGSLLVFCEVKTRVGSGDAVEGYGGAQQRRMVEMSEVFIVENADILPKVFDLRYDLIVIGAGEDGTLEVKQHISDAFRP